MADLIDLGSSPLAAHTAATRASTDVQADSFLMDFDPLADNASSVAVSAAAPTAGLGLPKEIVAAFDAAPSDNKTQVEFLESGLSVDGQAALMQQGVIPLGTARHVWRWQYP